MNNQYNQKSNDIADVLGEDYKTVAVAPIELFENRSLFELKDMTLNQIIPEQDYIEPKTEEVSMEKLLRRAGRIASFENFSRPQYMDILYSDSIDMSYKHDNPTPPKPSNAAA